MPLLTYLKIFVKMEEGYLNGILLDNKEFICHGKSLFLTDEEIKKYFKSLKEINLI